MQRISVDLPDPDGPHRTIFSPARTVKLMFVRALKSPYHFSTPSMAIMGCEEPSDVLCMFIALTLLQTYSACDERDPFNGFWHGRKRPLHPFFIDLSEFAVGFDLVEERVYRSIHFLFAKPGTRAVIDALEFDFVFPVTRFRFLQAINIEHVAAKPLDLSGNERLDRSSVAIEAKDVGAGRRVLRHLRILRGRPRDTDTFELRHVGGGFDLYRLGRDEKNDIRGVRLAELHRLRSLREHCHRCEKDIDPTGGQCRDAVGNLERHELNGHTQILAVKQTDVGIETLLFAARIDVSPRGVITLDADDDLA